MFSPEDTIVAIATPPGRGGLGVVRVSGPSACEVAGQILVRDAPLQPRHATFTRVRGESSALARVQWTKSIATWFPAPHSYTGEHSVEISTHGSPMVLQAVLRSAIAAGARLARPGEFTFRAFLNGRIDLIQAEAVARSDRRRDAAPGACGVRSARRHVDRPHQGARFTAARSRGSTRGVAGFSRRGVSLHRAARDRVCGDAV